MKKNLFYMAAGIAILASACTKEVQTVENAPTEEQGAPAVLTLSIKTGVATKAIGTDAENKLTDGKVYIFNETGTLAQAPVDLAAALNPGTKQTISTTAGTKYVYVLANLGSSYPADVAIGYNKGEFDTDALTINEIATIATDNSFVMSGKSEAVTVTGGESPTEVTVAIDRLAAKAVGTLGAGASDGASTATAPQGTLSSPEWTVHNVAKNMYYFQYGDPWSTPYPNVDSDFTTYYFNQTGTFKTGTAPVYFTENKVKTPRNGNATYLVLKAVFTPRETVDADGSNTQPGQTSETFFRITNAAGTEFVNNNYYRAQPTPTGDEKVIEYTNGVSYYRVLLISNPEATDASEKYSIPRNTCFNVTINGVTDSGSNTEEGVIPTDPETPIETSASLNVTISVNPWTDVNQSAGVGGL